MKTILATGGLGFVGSHTCSILLQQGFDVLILDSLINSSDNIIFSLKKIIKQTNQSRKIGNISFLKGDVRNKKLLREIFSQYKNENRNIEAVIHFAGLKSVSESMINPLDYWDTNINTTLTLLSVMKEYNCFSFLFSSSATVYKPIDDQKLSEKSEKYPYSPYGNTKLTVEKILQDVYSSNPNSWKILSLRYFNPVGAHPSGLIGEIPFSNSSNLFPVIMNVILGKQKKLLIYGNDWPTCDGTCIRDFIHIMDLSWAHLDGLKFIMGNSSQINSINIGTGKGISIMEVVKTFLNMGVSLPFEFDKRREGDFHYVVADNSLALNVLNWRPLRNLDEMCTDSLNWIENYKKINL